MIIVKVTYTVKPAFVQKNQENIKIFMADFKKLDHSLFHYVSYLSQDNKTFVHISHYKNEQIQRAILQTNSFLSFQKQRDESGLEMVPQIEVMTIVEESFTLFN